jgi:hypothetical protein
LNDVRAFKNKDAQNPISLTDAVTGVEITEIGWEAQDALPFPVCLSAQTDARHHSRLIGDVSVARGNILLADHGNSLVESEFPEVGGATQFSAADRDGCDLGDPIPVHPRYRIQLSRGPLTQVSPIETGAPTSDLRSDPRNALPAITLDDSAGDHWTAVSDLLRSHWNSRHFVAEVEVDGSTTLRFGDDRQGLFPDPGTTFTATYRVGNGAAGNVGRDTIVHIALANDAIKSVRNPLPAAGGSDPESIEEVRQKAPQAFQVPMRAVTEADYASIAQRKPGIQRAAAAFRWTGSWHTVYLMADELAGTNTGASAEFETALIDHIEPFRMARYDLEVESPRFVSVELALEICAHPDYFRSDVRQRLLQVLSNRSLSDGRVGLFHPDNFTFGQPVYLSAIYQAAQSVPGVATVDVVKFGRLGTIDPAPLRDSVLPIAPVEIARLDNDPDYPDHGTLTITVRGGK